MDFKPLVFVSGKGGVGKTTLSLLMARHLSTLGKKVLFVELGQKSSAQALTYSAQGPSYEPRATAFGFHWSLIDGTSCLVEYIGSLTKTGKLTESFFSNPTISSLLNVAPGLNDLAILGKLTSRVREHGPSFDYDHIIVDAPSTGSFSSLLAAPQFLGSSVQSGPMHTQSQGIDQVLHDSQYVQYVLVSLFEELPVDELCEDLTYFSKSFPGQISVVMNKKLSVNEPRIEGDCWQQFLKQKIVDEEKQKKRALEKVSRFYYLDLFTESFHKKMQTANKEFLRSTLSN